MKVTVVGAGVNGLCAAIRLVEAGHEVSVVTREPSAVTTSTVAGAVWSPYGVTPDDRVLAWSARTLQVVRGLADVPHSGIRMAPLLEVFDAPTPDPWWADAAPGFRHADPAELPPGFADGWVIDSAVMDSPAYIAVLVDRVAALGVTIEVRPEGVTDIGAVLKECDAAVNATGLGSRELVPDPSVVPVRGQVVRVRNPGLDRCLIDDHGPDGMTYVFPRFDDCILGGTSEPGEWDRTPDPAVTASIVERCVRLEPGLGEVEVLEVLVGLRPFRPAVRVEVEDHPDGTIVHDYGHGGAGLSLSWGCAEEVVGLLGAHS